MVRSGQRTPEHSEAGRLLWRHAQHRRGYARGKRDGAAGNDLDHAVAECRRRDGQGSGSGGAFSVSEGAGGGSAGGEGWQCGGLCAVEVGGRKRGGTAGDAEGAGKIWNSAEGN